MMSFDDGNPCTEVGTRLRVLAGLGAASDARRIRLPVAGVAVLRRSLVLRLLFRAGGRAMSASAIAHPQLTFGFARMLRSHAGRLVSLRSAGVEVRIADHEIAIFV